VCCKVKKLLACCVYTHNFMMQRGELAFSNFLALRFAPSLSELIILASQHYARHDKRFEWSFPTEKCHLLSKILHH